MDADADRPVAGWSASLRSALEEAHGFGFLGPGPVATHVEHAVGFASAWQGAVGGGGAGPARVVDLGSGGGVPALVLAELWPEGEFVLVEANQRRAEFLRRVVAGWEQQSSLGRRMTVVSERAETVGRGAYRGTADLVTARGFGPPPVTAECGSPFLKVGGHFVVSEPPDSIGDRWSAEGLARLGMTAGRVYRRTYGFFVCEQRVACPTTFPRRVGVPGKRPLF